jgi:hypothetical protein
VAAVEEEPVGFALHYPSYSPSYSTVVGRPGLHLEDLYVRAEHRGAGIGLALLAHLAHTAVQRGCARLEWWVLRTNDPALRFYRRLHARGLDEIEVMRLEGGSLRALAAGTVPGPRMGAVRGLLAAGGLSGPGASAAHFALLWTSDVVLYTSLGIADVPWRWTGRELATDLAHKGVYAAVTGAAYDALTAKTTR